MRFNHKLRRKGRDEIVEVWPEGEGTAQVILRSMAHLVGNVAALDEFFFDLPCRDEMVDRFEKDGLCRVTTRDKHLTLARATSWDKAGQLLYRLHDAEYMGVDSFAPATPGYVPRPRRLFSGGEYWFRHNLEYLKFFCIFHLEYAWALDMELWTRPRFSDACERLVGVLKARDAGSR